MHLNLLLVETNSLSLDWKIAAHKYKPVMPSPSNINRNVKSNEAFLSSDDNIQNGWKRF
jgi:hypothetical protein